MAKGVFSGYSFDEISKLKSIFKENFSKNHFILFGINKFSEKEKGVYNSLVITNYQLEHYKNIKNKTNLSLLESFYLWKNLLSKIGLKKITGRHGSF